MELGLLTEPTCSVTLNQQHIPWMPWNCCCCCLETDPKGWDTAGSDPRTAAAPLWQTHWNPHAFQIHGKYNNDWSSQLHRHFGDFEVDKLVIHVIPMLLHKTLLNFNTSYSQLQRLQLPLSSERGQESEWDRGKRKIPFPLQRTFCSTGWMEHLLQTSV